MVVALGVQGAVHQQVRIVRSERLALLACLALHHGAAQHQVGRDHGLAQYPLDEKLLGALVEGLPPCAGIALGVDRLAMLVLGAASIGDVNAFTTAEL